MSLTFAMYILKPFFPDCDPPTESVRLLAAVCICTVSSVFHFVVFFFKFLNIFGVPVRNRQLINLLNQLRFNFDVRQ